ncbi:MAG: exo-alpha-sialidase [Methylobacteriaceae bacterium]|nr:exo-alpha-sialidase [Methylobacteriaceae bacterium]
MYLRSQERTLIRDEHRYCAHPHMAVLASGTWLLAATCGPRRTVTMHPPQDPEFVNILIRSNDEGRSWSPPCVVPAYGWTGMECAGLTALPDGSVLLNQWRFRWYPYTAPPDPLLEPLSNGPAALLQGLVGSREIEPDGPALASAPETLMPWVRGGGEAVTHRSEDDGRTWRSSAHIGTGAYAGGYGMRGAVVLPDGVILLPLSDAPFYERIFLVRSPDGGRSWGAPQPVAAAAGRTFEEPAPLLLEDGTILVLLRENVSRTLYQIRSEDGGESWSPPAQTGIEAYPAHLLSLPDGRIAAVVGCRRPPYGIAIYVSADQGRSFGLDSPLCVRTGLPSKDLGYPTAALRDDGSLFVAYYYRDAAGVTGVHATIVAI